jgi:hypothetical protein
MNKNNLLEHLRTFIQTARSGSVSAAAKKLFLSQPSVSPQTRMLAGQERILRGLVLLFPLPSPLSRLPAPCTKAIF